MGTSDHILTSDIDQDMASQNEVHHIDLQVQIQGQGHNDSEILSQDQMEGQMQAQGHSQGQVQGQIEGQMEGQVQIGGHGESQSPIKNWLDNLNEEDEVSYTGKTQSPGKVLSDSLQSPSSQVDNASQVADIGMQFLTMNPDLSTASQLVVQASPSQNVLSSAAEVQSAEILTSTLLKTAQGKSQGKQVVIQLKSSSGQVITLQQLQEQLLQQQQQQQQILEPQQQQQILEPQQHILQQKLQHQQQTLQQQKHKQQHQQQTLQQQQQFQQNLPQQIPTVSTIQVSGTQLTNFAQVEASTLHPEMKDPSEAEGPLQVKLEGNVDPAVLLQYNPKYNPGTTPSQVPQVVPMESLYPVTVLRPSTDAPSTSDLMAPYASLIQVSVDRCGCLV